MNLFLLGPPGAGKGTQAAKLVQDFDVPYYATGDILRAAVKEESELDAGDARDGFLLDGFPRNQRQADALGEALGALDRRLTAALLIDVPDDEVVRRLAGRRVCVKNPSHIYHVDFDPPKHEGVCDQDGSRLIQRDDDKPEVVKKRLAVYHDQSKPLEERYEKQGILRRFDGTRPPAEVHDHIRAAVATLRMEEEL
ncbi:MAG: nucleoside monophosphate kinase [Actinobacteria bacterium]|nr:MAG: nucleoside monophosphate kinase [Actinomycetota bacterium]